jgi:hypothetical protein
MNPRQTATTDRSSCPSVFDAGPPTINYEHAQSGPITLPIEFDSGH